MENKWDETLIEIFSSWNLNCQEKYGVSLELLQTGVCVLFMKRKIKKWKKPVVVNNQANINKMNNYISSPIIDHEKDDHILVGYTGPGLGQTQQCGRVKCVNRITTHHS